MKRRRSRGRRGQGSTFVVTCPFVGNVVQSGDFNLSLSVLGMGSLSTHPCRPERMWARLNTNDLVKEQTPVAIMSLVDAAEAIVASRPLLCTYSGVSGNVRVPSNTDFREYASGNVLFKINIGNITSAETVVVTIVGEASVRFKTNSSATFPQVSAIVRNSASGEDDYICVQGNR